MVYVSKHLVLRQEKKEDSIMTCIYKASCAWGPWNAAGEMNEWLNHDITELFCFYFSRQKCIPFPSFFRWHLEFLLHLPSDTRSPTHHEGERWVTFSAPRHPLQTHGIPNTALLPKPWRLYDLLTSWCSFLHSHQPSFLQCCLWGCLCEGCGNAGVRFILLSPSSSL